VGKNIERLVESTNNIVAKGKKFLANPDNVRNIMSSPDLASALLSHSGYIDIGKKLREATFNKRLEILTAARSSNVNMRGNIIEQIITEGSNFHRIEDLCFELEIGSRVLVDVKTKILALSSSPKGYNIDKFLEELAQGNTVFSFYFIGINPEASAIKTCFVSSFCETIIDMTRIVFHWAGRNSRGVTQLTGDFRKLFSDDFIENIDIPKARTFLEMLLNN